MKQKILLWNLIWACISRDETFGGCNLEEYAESLKEAFNYFYPKKNIRYDTRLNVDGKLISIKDMAKIFRKVKTKQ